MILMGFLLIIPLISGWVAGWVVNYLADVLPLTRSLSQPVCLQCRSPYKLWHYLLFRPCPKGHSRNKRALIAQLVVTALTIFAWTSPPQRLGFTLGLLIITYFSLVFVIDIEHRLILHVTSIFGVVLGILSGYLNHGVIPTLVGGATGLGIMLVFYYLGVLFTRIRARRMQKAGQEADDEEALGAGDVILVTILGFMLGWPLIWFGLLVGILLGGLISFLIVIWLVAFGKYGKNAFMLFIPYGPYFIFSAFLMVFFPRWVAQLVPG